MDNRLHYMDHLRAGAMVLGIVFHGALAYASPIQDFWFIRDQGSSAILNCMAVFLHSFRMPLFFFVSGYFSKMIIEKRGIEQFLRNRFARIFLPFIIFWPILAILSLGVLLFALNYLDETPPLLRYLMEQADSQSGGVGDIGTLHLWFLYYLLFFGGVAAFFHYRRAPAIERRLNMLVASGLLFLVTPILIAPALFQAGHPVPSPDRLTPMLWPFGYFGVFFAIGWLSFGNEKALDKIDAHRNKIILLATGLFAFYYFSLPELNFPPVELATQDRLQLSVAGACATSLFVYLALSLGRQYLNIENAKVRYVADASFWLYLIHLPIVVFIQTLIAEITVVVWAKFAFTIIATTALGLLTYRLFVRNSIIGALLNGPKPSRVTPPAKNT